MATDQLKSTATFTTVTVAGVVPAAGASRRMEGFDKRRLPFRQRTVLEVTVDCLRQGDVYPIVVVLEPESPCRDLPGLEDTVIAVNPEPERGMLSSIRIGLEALPDEADAAAVLPGDHPFVPPEAVVELVWYFEQNLPLLLAPRYAGESGHPLIIARRLFGEAMACADDVGLHQLTWRRQKDLEYMDLNYPGANNDLDTPADLVRLDEKREDR